MENRVIDNWMEAYVLAWRTPGTDLLKEVFSEAIVYKTEPFNEPITGLEALAEFWEKNRDKGEEFETSHEIVATEGDTAVVRVDVTYFKPERQVWKDIWIMQFENDGRCFAFEEWPFKPGQSSS